MNVAAPTWHDDVAWLMQRQRFGIHPGLSRTRALLQALGSPEASMQITLVAGTNGKGSTTALLANMLSEEPQRVVGRFISPHLMHFRERFWVGKGAMSVAQLAPTLAQLRSLPEAADATFFELLVALALRAFADAGVSDAVLEVGIGGRWDATNATEPALSVITSIDLDHQEILGDTIEEIAAEKAGIMRPGCTTISSAQAPARAVLETHAQQLGARLLCVDDEGVYMHTLGWEGVEVVTRDGLRIRAPLIGAHQARNLATAVRAAQVLGVDARAIQTGAAGVLWPGRCEVLTSPMSRVTWLLDGAHNPAGARALRDTLQALQLKPAVVLMGLTDDRLATGLPRLLAELAAHVVVTRAATSARAAPPEAVLQTLDGCSGQVHMVAELTLAMQEAEAHALATDAERPVVLVAGSLYLVGDVRARLVGDAVDTPERWQ